MWLAASHQGTTTELGVDTSCKAGLLQRLEFGLRTVFVDSYALYELCPLNGNVLKVALLLPMTSFTLWVFWNQEEAYFLLIFVGFAFKRKQGDEIASCEWVEIEIIVEVGGQMQLLYITIII